jgi:hypothetical protein
MKYRKEYLILIVVIAVLLLYLTVRSTNRNSDPLPQPVKLEKAEISRLVLTDKQNVPVQLVKKDDRWFIEPQGYPVDNPKVNNMLHSLSDLTLTALVSESGNYERYGLNPGEKIFVQAFKEDKPVRAFSLGKPATTHQHTFVLLDGDPRIYHARGLLERTFDQSIESLRDKTIFDFDKNSIGRLTLTKKGRTLELSKIDSALPEPAPEPETDQEDQSPAPPAAPQWQTTDGHSVDRNSVERILDELDHLMCDAFLEDEARSQLEDSLWSVSLKKGEKEFSLSVHPKIEEAADKVPALASTTPHAFLLHGPRLEIIEKHLDTLLETETKKK